MSRKESSCKYLGGDAEAFDLAHPSRAPLQDDLLFQAPPVQRAGHRARRAYAMLAISGLAFQMQRCAFMAGAAAGAVGNEALEEEGYELENPMKMDDDSE